ncbi:RNA-binding protein [Bradyrhizobium sp. CB82]|uniref:RNA-binding protein n=1 Tax=Bradyrhizobium sp. CB82 TaxID=3039159 RepID=UPI0024B0A1FB|nr:RNA-binding protein [Bradyrhizobium sp. CB82]WFU42616.1 RNA-binding protein [Bradyrhizobium sp. CB82]
MTPKRPRDPNQLAKSIIDIATGQKPDRDPTPEEQGKDPAAAAMGKKGGKARADNLSPEKRAEIAKKAAATRWGKLSSR